MSSWVERRGCLANPIALVAARRPGAACLLCCPSMHDEVTKMCLLLPGVQPQPAGELLHVRHPHHAALVCVLHRQCGAGVPGHPLRDVLL